MSDETVDEFARARQIAAAAIPVGQYFGGRKSDEFIAMLDPQTVLAMLDALETAGRTLDGGDPDDLVDALAEVRDLLGDDRE